jgi:hypothetical protein
MQGLGNRETIAATPPFLDELPREKVRVRRSSRRALPRISNQLIRAVGKSGHRQRPDQRSGVRCCATGNKSVNGQRPRTHPHRPEIFLSIHSFHSERRKHSHNALISIATLSLAALAGCTDVADSATLTDPIVHSARRAKTRADTIVVSPASVSVTAGGSTQLSASVQTYAGQPLSMTVSWTSANSAIATVSPSGLVTGVAAGSTTVSASVSGARTNIPVTVTAAPGTTGGTGGTGAPVVAECSTIKTGWIFCDDFETNRMASYFEVDSSNGSFVRATSVGVGGSSGMRTRFAAGQVSAGSLKLAFGRTPSSYIRPVDGGTTIYRDVYWRVYVRNQAGWQGGGGDKLSRAQSIASANWSQAMGAPVWSGGQSSNWNYLVIDPFSGTDVNGTLLTTSYGDVSHIRWLGSAQSTTPVFDASHVGQWYCVEAHVRLNDAGQSNGTFDLWINGAAQASRTGLNWVGSFGDYGINTVFLENYWNSGSPVAQERYFDNFIVSTTRIGC